jgi:hypothetical protein
MSCDVARDCGGGRINEAKFAITHTGITQAYIVQRTVAQAITSGGSTSGLNVMYFFDYFLQIHFLQTRNCDVTGRLLIVIQVKAPMHAAVEKNV